MIDLSDLDAERTAELPAKPLKEWRDKFESNAITANDFIQYFQKASPFFLTFEKPKDYLDLGRSSFNEAGAKSAIIDVIDEFLLGDNPEAVLDKIKAEQNVSTVCNRVFKSGEPFYSCRECGVDPTCVLCVNCFKQSAHRHHKYKIGTSMGNGCCDCGDSEAWKQDSFCDEHKGTVQSLQSTVITERMLERCCLVFDAVMSYCISSLRIDGTCLKGLEIDSIDDTYCTVLYNDETHTFEQVINTLTRIVLCTHKDAVDYVTNIDREGRAVVKCAPFKACKQLKEDIEKQTSRPSNNTTKQVSLKVSVLHKDAVANQQFSLTLLSWFQELLSRSPVFRNLFADVISQNMPYNLRDILLNDSKLWKTARTAWHRLLISGMLMEHENKKALAVMFTKHYMTIMQEFIGDDHDHSFSIVSLSVQLFTVPSIAQHLIAQEAAFFKLMQTFYSESIEAHVKKKVIQFTRNPTNIQIFKRAAHILFDLKYILSFKPTEWTDQLRMEFLHGVQLLIRLLKEMQGMDQVHRQTGQHMEYEPEWESAFNLHIKLAPIISLVLDWCSSDYVVFVKVYRMTLVALSECDFNLTSNPTQIQELADHSAYCMMYDVSSKPVSIHLPLSRFFGGLYLLLPKFNLDYDRIAPARAGQNLPLEQIIEPVLCTQTMIAQVHAGMWRRNGYSLLNQLYFYRNVKCRAEMLDRDIVVMQIGASLIESNEFLIHVMNKFNLISWTTPEYETSTWVLPEEDGVRQVINMIDELLELLIVIVGERYVPGIGEVAEEDKIKKEIIQSLCIKPFTHSELSRMLPDVQNDDFVEDIIDSVAVFKKPTQSDKIGVYELKPQFFEDYNMYFYHYTKEEKSKSEEEQRKRRKAKNQLVCCPPPALPKLTPIFTMLANLLQCDVMLLIMQTVLKKAIDLKSKSFTDSHLQKILHLIGYAIQEQASDYYPSFQFYDRAAQWDILPLMEELVNSPRVEAHRDLILWTVRRYKELQPKNPNQQSMESDESIASTSGQALAPDQNKSTAEIEQQEKKDRARLAAERRAKIMAQMANAQKNFMTTNAELFESANATAPEKSETEDRMEWQENVEDDRKFVCLGSDRKAKSFLEDPIVTCILCSEDAVIKIDGPCMVYSAFVQRSKVLSHPNDIAPSPHTSTCGHVMHATCWKDYFNNEVMKENRRPNRNRSQNNFATEKKEFLCPLCRCLSNAVLPISPYLSRVGVEYKVSEVSKENEMDEFDNWMFQMKKITETFQRVKPKDDDDFDAEKILSEYIDSDLIHSSIKSCGTERDIISPELKDYLIQFTKCAQLASPFKHVDEKIEPFLVTWMSCAYTIETLEMYLRALNKPLKGQKSIRQSSCMSGLIRASGLLGTALDDELAAKIIQYIQIHLSKVFHNAARSIVEWDIFKICVMFIFSMPAIILAKEHNCIVPKGTMLEHYLLKMSFVILLVKIVVLHKFDVDVSSSAENSMEIDDESGDRTVSSERTISVNQNRSGTWSDSESESALVDFYLRYNIHEKDASDANLFSPTNPLSIGGIKDGLMDAIRQESRVFLRQSCLLFRFLTDIELPDALYNNDGDSFEVMCNYLGIDTDIDAYFRASNIRSFAIKIATHPELEVLRTSKRAQLTQVLVPTVSKVRRLVDLPLDYSDLINSVSTFTCPNNERDESRNPTMCLVCGTIMCSMTYCCQREHDGTTVGSCTYHALKCGAGVGIFLRIRECEILLLGMNKGCFVSPPYLDKYGETDQGLRRGNPLSLCVERYDKLHLMWLNHSLHEEIARSAEAINNVMPTQWIHL